MSNGMRSMRVRKDLEGGGSDIEILSNSSSGDTKKTAEIFS